MKKAVVMLAAAMLVGQVAIGHAASIQNRDQAEIQLRIIEEGQERAIALMPSEEVADLCATRCDLYVGADPAPYELIAADKLFIEGGQLLYDEDAPATAPDAPKQ